MILLATGNQHKAQEFEMLLPKIKMKTLHDHPLPFEIIEDADSFYGNAWIKAFQTHQHTGQVTLADDSGLSVDALQGAPGIYSARYVEGTDQDRYQALLKALEGVTDRAAHFTCALCLSGLSQEIQDQYQDLTEFPGLRWYRNSIITEGYCEGQISLTNHGTQGFGYDPIFKLNDGRYVGELQAEEKHKISHRAEACKKIYPFFKKIFDI